VTGKPETTGSFSLQRWLAFCLLFFGLPILLVDWEFAQAMAVREAQHRVRRELSLEKLLIRFSTFHDTADFFHGFLNRSLNRFRQRDTAAVTTLLRFLKRTYPRNLDYILLDSRGVIVRDSTGGVIPARSLQMLFTAFTPRGVDEPFVSKHWPEIRVGFGQLLKSFDIRPGVLKRISSEAAFQHVLFSGRQKYGLALIFLHHTPDWDTLAFHAHLHHFNQHAQQTRLGFFDSTRGQLFDPAFQAALGADVSRIFTHLGEGRDHYLHLPEGSLGHLFFTPKIRLLAYQPVKPGIRDNLPELVRWLSILLFGLLSVVAALIMQERIPWFLSIRTKLMLLFLFSAGLPLLVTTFLAWDYVQERRSLLEEKILRDLEATLRQIDRRFPRILSHFEQTIVPRIHAARGPKGTGPERLRPIMKELETLAHPDSYWVSDDEGKRVESLGLNITDIIKNLYKYSRSSYVNLVRNANDQEPQETGLTEDTLESFVSAGGLDMQELFAGLTQSTNRMGQVKLGEQRFYHLLVPVRDESGLARLMTFFSWRQRDMEHLYLRFFVPKILRTSPPVFLAAINEQDAAQRLTPHFARHFQEGWKRAIPENPVVRYRVRRGQDTLLVAVIRGNEVSGFQLGALTSDRQIRREIREVWVKLGGICGLILVLGYLFGIGLGRMFLQPVGHLEAGLIELKNRNFKHRLPTGSQDELGMLLQAFNQIAEGMEDLELAKALQEILLPGEAIQAPTFRIFGTCQPATRIGGDYFDYRALDENRFMFLIGDVSGHGAGAAMVVSIVKGIISIPGLAWEPAALLSRLNLVLLEILSRKKMMSLVLGYIAADQRKIVFANAGHHGPFLVRDGQTTSNQGENWVLGMRKKVSFTDEILECRPGDTVVFITDGVTEARGQNKEQIGPEKFMSILPGCVAPTPEETERNIRNWHKAEVRQEFSQEDDITLLIIQF
jgi:hypothetical protein